MNERRYRFQSPIRFHISRGDEAIFIGVSFRRPWVRWVDPGSLSIWLGIYDDAD